MFSRTERAFLRALAEGPPSRAQSRVEAVFPNPVYRRKLMWGIRRKADRSYADWELYTAATARESRLLPVTGADAPAPPLFADPIVVAYERLRRGWRRTRGAAPPRSNGPPPRGS